MNPREILKKENECIEEHAPKCTAACPMHVDGRAVAGLIKEKKFSEAAEVYRKAIFFPRIMAFGCHAPCKENCLRNQRGDSIELGNLEQAAITYGNLEKQSIKPFMAMSKKVAVIGAGISGMMTALALAEKGFKITVYEKDRTPGGKARNIEGVTQNFIEQDFEVCFEIIEAIKYETNIGEDISFAEIYDKYDAVYISRAISSEGMGLELDSKNSVKVDPITLQSSNAKVFAGGGEDVEKGYLPMKSMEEGKRASVSMDRFLKGASLKAARSKEGPYETMLYTNLDGVVDSFHNGEIYRNLNVYTEDEAVFEAERCFECRCMECVKECSFLAKHGKYPKSYIREVFNNLSTICIGFRSRKPMINSCSMCGLCKELCPNSLSMADIFKSARQNMVKTDAMPPRYHEFPLRDMAFSNSDKFSLCRHEPGKKESGYVFFPGCQLAAGKPEYIKPVYEYLCENISEGVGLMLGCCGAPADWAGREDLYNETIDVFKEKWEAMGRPKIITACPTCKQQLTESLPEAELTTAWSIYNKYGLPKDALAEAKKSKLSIHDACTARHDVELQDDVRELLKKTGYEIEEVKFSKDKTRCCGYGGLMIYGDKALALQILEERRQETELPYMTYCAVCRDYLADGKKPTFHILDAIYGKMDLNSGLTLGPNIEDRRLNRGRLKKLLLQEIWKEKWEADKMAYSEIELIIEPEIREILNERLILDDNLREVIWQGETNGTKILNPTNGHNTAYFKPKVVTYWVEYEKEGSAYKIYNAYCHRIEIVKE